MVHAGHAPVADSSAGGGGQNLRDKIVIDEVSRISGGKF
jgi:hypothetical protein